MKVRLMQPSAYVMTLAVAAMVACSSSDNTGPGGSGSCSITLSGAQTGSPECSGVTTIWTADENKFVFGFFTSLAASPAVIVSVSAPGEPTARTYQLTDTGELGSAVVTNGNNSWLAQTDDPAAGSAATGSYTLTISSISTITSAAEGKVYRAHGTFTATLQADAQSGTTGTVTLKATF